MKHLGRVQTCVPVLVDWVGVTVLHGSRRFCFVYVCLVCVSTLCVSSVLSVVCVQYVQCKQVSYEALKISHTFSMDDSGAQTCLQHENMLVPVQNH